MATPPGVNLSQRLIAALVAAFVTVLLVSGAGLLGVVGSLLYLIAAIPSAYSYMRYGALSGVCSVLYAVLAIFGFFGLSGALLEYILLFGTPSLLLPFLLIKGWRWDQAVAVTVVAVTVLAVVLTTAVTINEGTTISTSADRFVETQMEQIRASLPSSPDLTAEQQREIRLFIQNMDDWLRQTYPAIVVLGITVFVLFQVWILSLLSGRHYSVPGDAFVNWKVPELLIWALIASGLLYFVTDGLPKQIGLNLLIVILLIYYVQGLAIVTELFIRKQVPIFMRVMGYTMVLLFNPIPVIVAGIGVFDLWIDFRKKRIKGN